MWKTASPPTSGIPVLSTTLLHPPNPPLNPPQNSYRSSTAPTTVPSTAKTTPQQQPPSTPPTPFLRSRSEVRFALDHNFALNSTEDTRIPPLPSILAPALHAPAPAPSPFRDNIHFSPDPNKCYRAPAAPPQPQPKTQNSPNLIFTPNANNCYRLAAPRPSHLPSHPTKHKKHGPSIPLRGQYVAAFADADADAADVAVDDDAGSLGDDDAPPGLDEGLPTAMARFAWAYVKGLGGLVAGVMDGCKRGAGGEGRAGGYVGYGGYGAAVAYEVGRR